MYNAGQWCIGSCDIRAANKYTMYSTCDALWYIDGFAQYK